MATTSASGPKPQLDWFKRSVAKEYEISVAPRRGPGKLDAKDGRALNCVIRLGDRRIKYEADPRQVAERLIAECWLEGANGMATPGSRPRSESSRKMATSLELFTRHSVVLLHAGTIWQPTK